MLPMTLYPGAARAAVGLPLYQSLNYTVFTDANKMY
jgi:hypothetical protein